MRRREFVNGMAMAGVAGALGLRPEAIGAEPPPETTTIRISYGRTGFCVAPQYVAEDLLRGEGFTDVEYVKNKEGIIVQANALAGGAAQRQHGASADQVRAGLHSAACQGKATRSTSATRPKRRMPMSERMPMAAKASGVFQNDVETTIR